MSDSVSPADSERAAGHSGDAALQNYRKSRQPNEYRNLRFYMNKIPLVPDGIYIEEILSKWRGDYDKLEHNHTYIQ
ncbi:Opioid growth factor receptor-like protein 1, partial [Xenoophorus captivus]